MSTIVFIKCVIYVFGAINGTVEICLAFPDTWNFVAIMFCVHLWVVFFIGMHTRYVTSFCVRYDKLLKKFSELARKN